MTDTEKEEDVEISKEYFLGEGGTKLVYAHPLDEAVCIKIVKDKTRAKNGLLREIKYLKKHQKNLPFLAAYLGEIRCNLGVGYLYEMARNEDGSRSEEISSSLDTLDRELLKTKVTAMYHQLIEQHAVVNDLQLPNIFIKKKLSGGYDLCLVDGFGNSDFIKICDYSKFFLMKKLNRKFNKLCKRLCIDNDFIEN